MKKMFEILMETKATKTLKIEAETVEEAVRAAFSQRRQTVHLAFSPTWVEEAEKAQELGELSMEIVARCDNCGDPIVCRHKRVDGTMEEHPKAWPWLYGTPSQEQVGPDKSPDYFIWCYQCLQSPLHQLAAEAE